MTRALRCLLFLLAITALAAPAAGQQSLRAAAVVNDQVISILDVEMRLRLVALSSGISDTPEQRQRLTPQVLRTLIDERLQLQEAERLGLAPETAEVDSALAQVARNNNMQTGQFLDILRRSGVPPRAFRNRIRANVAWQKILAREIRPQVQVRDEDVQAVVDRLKSSEGERRLRVSEILLSVDDAGEDEQAVNTARRLLQQLRQGADFASLARQFSQSATASVGGDLGWLTPGSLPEEVSETLRQMDAGQVAGPIRTYAGYYIVKLQDVRRISVGQEVLTLKQVYLPLPQGADGSATDALRAQASEIAAGIDGCDSVGEVAGTVDSASSGDLGEIAISDLPPQVRSAVVDVPVGQAAQPVPVNNGLSVLVVCERQTMGIDREQIRENLTRQQIDRRAQRYMRDLRRRAHIDIRL